MKYHIAAFEDIVLSGSEVFDLMLFSVTGESRSWEIPETYRSQSGAWVLMRRNEHLASDDLESEIVSRLHGASVISAPTFEAQLRHFMERRQGPVRILVDVTCMTRADMGLVFSKLLQPTAPAMPAIELTVAYVIAEFSPPPAELSPNEHIQPIAPDYAGWPDNAVSSTTLIIGLGYELGKADGACEYFDASENWVFFPESPLPAYDVVVDQNNRQIIERAVRQRKLIKYPVARPAVLLARLGALVADQVNSANPLVLPFGPKIFVAVSLIVASVHSAVGVWHATGDTDLPAVDHKSSSHVASMTVRFEAESVDV